MVVGRPQEGGQAATSGVPIRGRTHVSCGSLLGQLAQQEHHGRPEQPGVLNRAADRQHDVHGPRRHRAWRLRLVRDDPEP